MLLFCHLLLKMESNPQTHLEAGIWAPNGDLDNLQHIYTCTLSNCKKLKTKVLFHIPISCRMPSQAAIAFADMRFLMVFTQRSAVC